MNIRTLVVVSSIGFVGLSSSFAEGLYSKYTADFYKGAYDSYEGKTITLKVAFVKPYSYKSDIEDVRFFHAITRDDVKKMNGGEIPVAVPLAGGEDFIRRYGTAPSEKGQVVNLTGVLRADGRGLWFVDVNGTITKKIDARKQTEMKSPTSTALPSPSPSTGKTTGNGTTGNGTAKKDDKKDSDSADAEKPGEAQTPWWKVW